MLFKKIYLIKIELIEKNEWNFDYNDFFQLRYFIIIGIIIIFTKYANFNLQKPFKKN